MPATLFRRRAGEVAPPAPPQHSRAKCGSGAPRPSVRQFERRPSVRSAVCCLRSVHSSFSLIRTRLALSRFLGSEAERRLNRCFLVIER